MTKVFIVQHSRKSEGDYEDVKLIGVYSSKNSAESVVTRLKDVQGFNNHPEGFSIDEYKVDEDHWLEGFSG